MLVEETPGKPEDTAPDSPPKQIFNFLCSMRLGIILLLLLALVSAYATGQEMERAIEHIYHSWWFIAIIAFTALNLLLCTARRLGPLSRQALKPKKTVTAGEIRAMPIHCALRMTGEQNPFTFAAGAFKNAGLHISLEEGPTGTVLFGEKGRLGYLGSIVSHLSILIILFGAMYGALTGYEETNGGWIGAGFFVPGGNFQVEITDIRMVQEANPVIRPRVYTDLTISRDNQLLKKDTVSINEPIRFEGNTIYHSTFIYLPYLKLTDLETGETGSSRFMEGDRIYLDARRTTYMQLKQFFSNFSMRPDGSPYNLDYRTDNPVAGGILVRNGRPDGAILLPLNKPNIFETPAGRVEAVLTGYELATVLSITKNLGRPYLFFGALLMVIGLYMSFFLIPRRFWARYDEGEGLLLIGGRGFRHRLHVEQAMERIEEDIIYRRDNLP